MVEEGFGMGFRVSDRVRVPQSYTWAKGALGTINVPPDAVQNVLSEEDAPYEGCRRVVYGEHGPVECYWVDFDEPQVDADGDGPYRGAEISTEWLDEIE